MLRDHSNTTTAGTGKLPGPSHASTASSLLAATNSASSLSGQAMGQAESTTKQPELGGQTMPPQPTGKFRLGWPGRRKKSEDFSKVITPFPMPSPTAAPPLPNGTSKDLARIDSNLSSVSSTQHMLMHELSRPPSRTSSAKQLTLQFASNTLSALKGKLNASQASIHSLRTNANGPTSPTSPPPPLPPKPDLARLSASSSRSSQSENTFGDWVALEGNGKPLPPPTPTTVTMTNTTPDDSAPVTEVEAQSRHHEIVSTATTTASPSPTEHSTSICTSSPLPLHDVNSPPRRERPGGRREGGAEAQSQSAKEIADDWRKSDSTLRTVRLVGSRTPRPLSLAESTNSGHTVLPSVSTAGNINMNHGAGKRLSALMTDADFGLKEVDSEEDEEEEEGEESVHASAPHSAFHLAHNLLQRGPSPSSSRSSSPASASGSGKAQPTPRRSSFSIRIGRLSGSKARSSDHGQLNGSDSDALSSSVSTRGTGGTDMGMYTANSSTTSITSSSLPDTANMNTNTKEDSSSSRPSIEIASSASIASTMSSEQRPLQYAQYKANAKLEPWSSSSFPTTNRNHPASESQASLSLSTTSESASISSQTDSPGQRNIDTDRSGSGKQHVPNTNMSSPPRGPTLRPAHQRTRLQSIQARGFRQTAVSLTTGLAPAAGFARKAVDRLGRALGGSSGSLAHSSSDADENQMLGVPSQYAVGSGSNGNLFGMVGTGQNALGHGHHDRQRQYPPSSAKKAMRRHGASPSGTWSVNSSDTDGGAAGPNLGRCLRGPLMPPNNGNGLVFGRDLALCVKDTACDSAVESGVDGLSLEGRSLPALAVRCAQHIVKWGVQEEGLFRISGRSTHISKLRAEFDSGADYDLRECGPGEIDPHAVSSIFKAYLRELPEPLLTRHLMPYFEAALRAENNMINAADAQHAVNAGAGRTTSIKGVAEHKRVPGLPSGPRDSVQVRKAPSLSTFAVPTLSPHTASQTLLNALSALIARLPKEHRDLLRTVTELIMATARACRETKMPLSNLLLVFCPSLFMNPPLLRVLCEGKGIWDGPLEVEEIPSVLGEVPNREIGKMEEEYEEDDENKTGRSSEESDTGLHHQGTIRRAPRVPIETKSDSNDETEPLVVPPTLLPQLILPSDDRRGYAGGGHTKTNSSFSASINLSSPDGLTHSSSSSDSLHTPPTSSPGSVSPNASLVPCASATKPALDTTGLSTKVMALHAQSDLPSPLLPSAVKKAVRKSLIGNPAPFPLGIGMRSSNSGSAPVTPIELSSTDKLSLTSHSSSSPNLSRDGNSCSPGGTPPRLSGQKSKASLLGLKSKRSLSSLLGIAQEQKEVRPLRSAVPDLATMEFAHPPRSSTPCPVLELPVDTTRISLDASLGLSATDGRKAETSKDLSSTIRVASSHSRSLSPLPSPASDLRTQGAPVAMDRSASNSSGISNSVFYTPPTSTRALTPSAANSANLASLPISSNTSTSSGSYSFLDFNLGKTSEDDDWAKSVLQAAASDA